MARGQMCQQSSTPIDAQGILFDYSGNVHENYHLGHPLVFLAVAIVADRRPGFDDLQRSLRSRESVPTAHSTG
jgi:hypothetical protein